MGSIFQHPRWRDLFASAKDMSVVPYLVIAASMTLSMWTVFVGDSTWRPADAETPDAGYLAVSFGLMFALLVGSGVMTFLFYDEAPRFAPVEGERARK
jgi:hypothetical protein